ncbi:i-AAA protease yme1, partial [Exophiala xenobiotica]
MALQAPLSQLSSLSAIGPDVFTTLPSLITSPLQTLRRQRLARLRAEGNVPTVREVHSTSDKRAAETT